MNVYQALIYNTSRWLAGPLIAAKLRLKCIGKENVPDEGGALIVANHRSLLDPILIGCEVERQVNFAAGSFAFGIPLVSSVFKAWGAIPINVFGGEKSKADLEYAVELLRQGELVGVFPEGIHTLANPHRVSKIQSFRTGFARIAIKARVPIIPIAVKAVGERNLPRVPYALVKPFFDHPEFKDGVRWIIYKRAIVRIGRPLDLKELYGSEVDKPTIDRISGKVRRVIVKLYDGEEMDRFVTGEKPFDIVYDRV